MRSLSDDFALMARSAAIELCTGDNDRLALFRARYLELGGAPTLAAIDVGRSVRSVFLNDPARAIAADTL